VSRVSHRRSRVGGWRGGEGANRSRECFRFRYEPLLARENASWRRAFAHPRATPGRCGAPPHPSPPSSSLLRSTPANLARTKRARRHFVMINLAYGLSKLIGSRDSSRTRAPLDCVVARDARIRERTRDSLTRMSRASSRSPGMLRRSRFVASVFLLRMAGGGGGGMSRTVIELFDGGRRVVRQIEFTARRGTR